MPPPPGLGREWCGVLAGSAEYLCRRYKLPIPAWTEERQFFLPIRSEFVPLVDLWVPWPWFGEAAEHEWEGIPEEFRGAAVDDRAKVVSVEVLDRRRIEPRTKIHQAAEYGLIQEVLRSAVSR